MSNFQFEEPQYQKKKKTNLVKETSRFTPQSQPLECCGYIIILGLGLQAFQNIVD